MDELVITLLIVFTGIVLIPWISRRIHLPVIVTEIIFGIVIGRSLLNLIPQNMIIDFFSAFGLAYLMFLGGIETDFGKMHGRVLKKAAAVVAASVMVPFTAGFLLSFMVRVNPFLLGTIFCTTSLGLTLPMLRGSCYRPQFARLLLASVVLVDIISLFLLAFVLTGVQGSINASFFYSFTVIVTLFLLPWLIRRRKLRRKITSKLSRYSLFNIELRLAFALIFLLAAISISLGFHAVIGGFVAGLIVSEILPHKLLQAETLQGFGYAFFIPMFFIFTGANVNLQAVFSDLSNIAALMVIVVAAILSKIVGVGITARLSGFRLKESLALGVFHSGRLSLIVAAADISIRLGLIGEDVFSMLIILAIISATMAPLLAGRLLPPGG